MLLKSVFKNTFNFIGSINPRKWVFWFRNLFIWLWGASILYWNILWSLFSMHVSCQDFSHLCSKEVCVPNVETNRQMYAALNKTFLCSRFWEAEKPDSGLNSYLQAVTDAVGYPWLPFWTFSVACFDSLSEISNTKCGRFRSVGQKQCQHVWKN